MEMGKKDDNLTLWYEVGKKNLVRQPWFQYIDCATNSVSDTKNRFNPAMLPEFKKGSLKRSRGKEDQDGASGEIRPTKRTSSGSTTGPCSSDSEDFKIPSLKRERSGDDYDTYLITQDQPKKRVFLGSTISTGSMSPFSNVTLGILHPQLRCIHKIKTGCSLASMACCCACADKRAESSAYLIYVDGEGDVMTGKRWHWYCKGCNSTTLTFLHLLLNIN